MDAFMRVVHDIGLLIARLALGLVLAAHGWHRYHTGVQAQIDYLSAHGVPNPTLLAWGAIVAELVGGLLLVFGLATRIVGAVLVVENVLIIVWLRFGHGVFVTDGGYEYNLITAALALILVCFGAGRTGVDNLFGSPGDRENRRSARTGGRPVDDADPA